MGIAGESGSIKYLVDEKTAVKKGHPVVSVEASSEQNTKQEPRYGEYTKSSRASRGCQVITMLQ